MQYRRITAIIVLLLLLQLQLLLLQLYNSSSDAGRYPSFVLGFRRRRAAARSQALAAASTGVWTDFSPIFTVRLNIASPRVHYRSYKGLVFLLLNFMIPKATAPARAARIVTMCNRYAACFVLGN